MQRKQWEIIILKPTRVFLSFLASQLPGVVLPALRLLQTDNTAYIIPKHDNDEDTLNEIESHFITMFRYEIKRWLGEHAFNNIEGSFLDFLCCFKFELHSQILLMEPSLAQGRQLLRVKPRSVLLKWFKSTVEEHADSSEILERISLSHLAENATVVIKNFSNLTQIDPYVSAHYYSIFATEMTRMCERAEDWPAIDSYQTFKRYFSIEPHTHLVNCTEDWPG